MLSLIPKRLFTILIFCFISAYSFAQTTIEHMVNRGESLSYIAQKYGVTEQAIKQMNKDVDFDMLYVGLQLRIPKVERKPVVSGNTATPVASASAPMSTSNSYIDGLIADANTHHLNGQYKKAIKLYSEALTMSSRPEIYYLRGKSYYIYGKYKKAIKDLEIANKSRDLPMTYRSSCSQMLADAKQKREEQLERREQIWSGIIGAAALTTVAVLEAKASNNANNSTYSGASVSSDVESTTSSYDSYTPSSSGGGSSNTASTRQCPSCQNTRHCSQCRGTGYRTDNSFGTGQDPTKKCGICGGDGVCSRCNGTGRI